MRLDGNAIRVRRELKGWRQDKLSEVSGLTQSTISRLESNRQVARMSTALALAEALGVPLAEIARDVPPSKGDAP